MSGQSEVEQEQEQQAPTMSDVATGPLLPKWFIKPFYVVFTIHCVFGVYSIVRSMQVQAGLRRSIEAVHAQDGLDLSGAEGRRLLDSMKEHPVDSFLYANQQILQDEEKDLRMARAMALRRAVGWGRISQRKSVVRRIAENMNDDGSLVPGFEIDDQMRGVLQELVEERRADVELTYVEDLITEVLAWLAEGPVEPARGPEKRRMDALLGQYAKKVFLGTEAAALELLIEEWRQEANPVAKEAAERFVEMFGDRPAELSPEAVEFCIQRANQWEDLYRDGMMRLGAAGYEMVEQIMTQGRRLDHPHIYQYISLLNHRFEGVRQSVGEGVWLLRHNKFAIRFVSLFATKTTINSTLAVETLRLTKEENEREMRHANNRRMREAVAILGRIGVDYVQNSADYAFADEDPDEFVGDFVLGALQGVADEEWIADLVAEALENLRRADLAQPGGARFFLQEDQ